MELFVDVHSLFAKIPLLSVFDEGQSVVQAAVVAHDLSIVQPVRSFFQNKVLIVKQNFVSFLVDSFDQWRNFAYIFLIIYRSGLHQQYLFPYLSFMLLLEPSYLAPLLHQLHEAGFLLFLLFQILFFVLLSPARLSVSFLESLHNMFELHRVHVLWVEVLEAPQTVLLQARQRQRVVHQVRFNF